MRFTQIAALFLTVAIPCSVYGQRAKKPVVKPVTPAAQARPSASTMPPPITALQNFYYRVAIYGYARTKTFGKPYDIEGYDNVDFYGETFDNDNYKRAMADEFERNRYRARIRTKIAEEVRKVKFDQKFTSVGYEKFGEYSFERHSFPIGSQNGVNGNQFASSLPMSEADASAFVKSRATASGNINRTVKVRITYSVVNDQAGFSLLNAVYTPYFKYFIYSVEVFSDEEMTRKLGVIPRISTTPSNGDEWRLAKVASLTATKEIGKYRYIYEKKPDGKIHNPLDPNNPLAPNRPKLFGTITLTDVGVIWSDDQSQGGCNFFEYGSGAIHLRRAYFKATWQTREGFKVLGFGCQVSFETEQERDRFFIDFTRAFQEWKAKFALFQFASGELIVDQRCQIENFSRSTWSEMVPCSPPTSSKGEPVWQTTDYRVTVESLERKANNYIATLVFENLTNESIKIGWEEKSSLLPDAVGPHLIDENGKKYFVEGTDSANIITSSFIGRERPAEILPKTKLTSRFVFSGSGDGKTFNLEAKGIEWPTGKPITIKGLKVTLASEVKGEKSPRSIEFPGFPVPNKSLDEAYTNLFNAVKSKNTLAIRNEMSKDTQAFAEAAAVQQQKPVGLVYMNGFTGTTFSLTLPTMRAPRIKDRFGALEVYNEHDKVWEDLPFVYENGGWRLAIGELFNGKYQSPGKGPAQRAT
jgi:hypothetical protein